SPLSEALSGPQGERAQAPTKVVVITKPRSRLLAREEAAAPAAEPAQAEPAVPEPAAARKPVAKVVLNPKSGAVPAAKARAEASQPVKAVKAPQAPASTTAAAVSRTTDATALSAIDTSGYVLPGVKVPGRRGRKPSEFQPETDEI